MMTILLGIDWRASCALRARAALTQVSSAADRARQ
jgi:hypothetical protein